MHQKKYREDWQKLICPVYRYRSPCETVCFAILFGSFLTTHVEGRKAQWVLSETYLNLQRIRTSHLSVRQYNCQSRWLRKRLERTKESVRNVSLLYSPRSWRLALIPVNHFPNMSPTASISILLLLLMAGKFLFSNLNFAFMHNLKQIDFIRYARIFTHFSLLFTLFTCTYFNRRLMANSIYSMNPKIVALLSVIAIRCDTVKLLIWLKKNKINFVY